jgi:hypothetical protein
MHGFLFTTKSVSVVVKLAREKYDKAFPARIRKKGMCRCAVRFYGDH